MLDGAFRNAVLTQKGARHFEIEVASSPRRAPVRPLVEIIKAFAAASAKGEALWRQAELALEIAGARFNKAETRAILLLHFKQGDADPVSSHLVIDLTSGSRYAAILEDAVGISKPLLEHALSALAQRWCSFYAMGPGGKFSEVRPRLSFVESTDASMTITVERALALCEPQILPEVSAKLDALLKLRMAKRAA